MQSILFEIWCLVLGIWAWADFGKTPLQGPRLNHRLTSHLK